MAMITENVAIKRPKDSNGVLFYLPANTNVDANPATPLPVGAKSAGYIAASGFTFAEGQEAGDGIVAFGGDTVVNGTTTMNPTVTFSILEVESKDAMALAYNENDLTDSGSGLKLTDTGATPSPKTLVFEFALKGNKVERVVLANAEFSTRGDRTIDNENPDSIEVTYNVRRDNNGVYRTSQVAAVTTED